MEKRPEEEQLRVARQFLHRAILEQRAATEELRSSNRELEALLEELLSARTDLRAAYREAMRTETLLSAPPRVNRTRLLAVRDVDVKRLEREVERVLQKARETVHESAVLRLRSKRLRAALRTEAPHTPKSHATNNLSKRERQVLSLIVEGKSSKEIAAELGISFKTAVTHRASIMGKLDVHEIASVVREAIRRGLV